MTREEIEEAKRKRDEEDARDDVQNQLRRIKGGKDEGERKKGGMTLKEVLAELNGGSSERIGKWGDQPEADNRNAWQTEQKRKAAPSEASTKEGGA